MKVGPTRLVSKWRRAGRLVRIEKDDETVDLQPCGGTHVARASEVGPIQVEKVENKEKNN
jgi:misacylated tRNA(Ala) deacylase